MTRLSVNINKVATLRNARGANTPNLVQVAKDLERFGAEGITVHPRPDERHIRYADVKDLSRILTVEFNIEGYPNSTFIDLVKVQSYHLFHCLTYQYVYRLINNSQESRLQRFLFVVIFY